MRVTLLTEAKVIPALNTQPGDGIEITEFATTEDAQVCRAVVSSVIPSHFAPKIVGGIGMLGPVAGLSKIHSDPVGVSNARPPATRSPETSGNPFPLTMVWAERPSGWSVGVLDVLFAATERIKRFVVNAHGRAGIVIASGVPIAAALATH